ncbi:MAG: cytochrome c biogenesis protein CcdA, partial [Lachnospiraceae bacterium]|nr:cytochrome c biogenesis protein CcdA [Lachnospiraceae bacterium]
MGFSVDVSVPVLTVFCQGLLSFFSPCVLPLLPLYIGYLSGGTGSRGEDGRIHYEQGKVMLHTLFFVIGISFAFVVLGLGVSAVGTFFKSNQAMFARIGGILVVLFGLYQMGVFGTSSVLGRERRLPFRIDKLAMSPFAALLMGFTFSFAWTPCVGPALTSVLLMAASAGTRAAGMGLIGVYTLGFVLPFLVVGVFTTSLLEFFKKNMKLVQYTVKIGGLLMIFMGVLMFTGKMNAVTGYLSNVSLPQTVEKE